MCIGLFRTRRRPAGLRNPIVVDGIEFRTPEDVREYFVSLGLELPPVSEILKDFNKKVRTPADVMKYLKRHGFIEEETQ